MMMSCCDFVELLLGTLFKAHMSERVGRGCWDYFCSFLLLHSCASKFGVWELYQHT